MEVGITIDREESERKLFGFTVFADAQGGGLPIVFRPETSTLRVGSAEAPFSIANLPAGEDVRLRIFVDRHIVEVFVNERQAMVAHHRDYQGHPDLAAFTVGASTRLKRVETWKIHPTNQGFRDAQTTRLWEPSPR